MSNILKIAAVGVEAAAPSDYQISRSLRFNSADSAYLNRTFSSPTSATIWTFSLWAKRGALGSTQQLLGASTTTSFGFNSSDQLNLTLNGTSAATSTAVFRDPLAWYHIVYQQNGSAQTIYVNNVSVATGTTAAAIFNTAIAHQIGAANTTNYFNGYLTEIHFVDGQALTPSSFGETDATTGVWKPKAYAGTYGTNGFHLDFSDNTSTTTIGYDAAGSNDWTANNFSVAAGADNDSLVDTPTPYGTDTGAGGEVRGNYCTLNPLTSTLGGGSGTASNGNLAWVGTGGNDNIAGTMSASSGKFYYEVTIVAQPTRVVAGWSTTEAATHYTTAALFFFESACIRSGTKTSVWGVDVTTGLTFSNGDVIGFAIDIDGGELKVYQNNSLVSTITLPTDKGDEWIPCIGDSSSTDGSVIVNFGQRPFAYTAPSGYKALCTTNLPDPTIVQGDDYFNTVLYTGTGSSQSITGVGFQPDWVWIKERSGAADHGLYDAVRGVQQQLESNTTTAETTESTGLTAFGSDGFTVGSLAQLNTNTDTYVAWNWNAGGSNATNTDGTITSTVRANPTAGFSIVSYTGNGTRSGQTVGHGLGVAPSMIVHKPRSTTVGWFVTHSGIPNAWILLNTTGASQTGGGTNGTLNYQSTNTSTVFSFIDGSSSINNVNGSGTTYIAYCFAEVEGYSKFGSYTGNGSAEGPFVYANHRPAFIMVKRTDTTSNWTIIDTKRAGYNVDNDLLYPNLSSAEGTTDLADILSNGFKLRSIDASVNASGGTYIFMSLASNPFKFSLAR